METIPKDLILDFSPNTLENVRKNHGLEKPGEMANAVNILDQWVKLQNHFTKKNFDSGYLERLIISCKGSVERSKERLDKLCTLRTFMPHFFEDYDVKKDFANIEGIFSYVPLPRMGRNYERVFFIKSCGKKFDNEIFLSAYRNAAMLVEYFKFHDYADSYAFIVDLRETNMADFITKLGLVELRQIVTLITDGYGLRIKGIHIMLTESKIIDTLVSILKTVLSEKLGSRLKVHKTMESVYEVCPKEIMAKEYGGEEVSLEELRVKWLDILSSEEFRSKWREMISAKTDESRRPTDRFNDQYMGTPGTFRALTVD